jgi:hypothetical protein
MITEKDVKKYNGEKMEFSKKCAWITGYPQAKSKKKKKNLDTDLTPFIKVNSETDSMASGSRC